jgi:hypothetical protein
MRTLVILAAAALIVLGLLLGLSWWAFVISD